MRRIFLWLCISMFLLMSCHSVPEHPTMVEKLPEIYPDYIGVTIPADIAPLNFNMVDETIDGMGTTLSFYRHLNEQHYAAQHPDVLQAEEGAFVPLVYDDNYGAAVAYSGDNYRTFTMGFPFECIKSKNIQASIMKGILTYLIK